jgi:hypothetical protein
MAFDFAFVRKNLLFIGIAAVIVIAVLAVGIYFSQGTGGSYEEKGFVVIRKLFQPSPIANVLPAPWTVSPLPFTGGPAPGQMQLTVTVRFNQMPVPYRYVGTLSANRCPSAWLTSRQTDANGRVTFAYSGLVSGSSSFICTVWTGSTDYYQEGNLLETVSGTAGAPAYVNFNLLSAA